MNEILAKVVPKADKESAQRAMSLLSDVSRKAIDELYTAGLQPSLVEECMKVSENIHRLICNDAALAEILNNYEDLEPSSHTHLFLVSFFANLICKNLDWVGDKTRETVAMGAFLHDIGMLKLPASLRETIPEKMNEKQIQLFREHPRFGAEMLQGIPTVNEQVRQIVYQHHEQVNGDGFPNGMSGAKIYPLAKIVALADEFSYLMVTKRNTPINTVRELLGDRNRFVRFDPVLIKALIQGFISDKAGK